MLGGLSTSITSPGPHQSSSSTRSRRKIGYADKFALTLTGVALGSFLVLSLVFSDPQSSLETSVRWLVEDEGNTDDATDYSSYSCQYLYEQTPNAGDNQCKFARTCNGGNGIWAPFIFCSKRFSATFLAWIVAPFMILWMILLFRTLGSSAEDFFSPSLEMFSMKLGLPPRFAGVTLLAIGNGAADISATVSSITSDPVKGYELSLGALTGAAMFISGVISAVVVLAAEGVPCRGALVRDATMLCITVLVVWYQLGKGKVGPETVSIFFSLYLCFVVLVLVADIYHRAVVVPRLAAAAQERERFRQVEAQRLHDADFAMPTTASHEATEGTQNRFAAAISALSNYDNHGQTGWSVESDDLARDRPVVLHGSHGIMRGGDGNQDDGPEHSAYSILDVDHACVEPGTRGVPAGSWPAALHDGMQELIEHAGLVWSDIVYNNDVHAVSKFLLILEFPFTVLRKITIAIPCEGHYVRSLVSLSLLLSPLWFVYYVYDGHEYNLLAGSGWFYFLLCWGVTSCAGLFILRYAPGADGEIALPIATPIALYGFVIAASWIDTIADSLVSLLNFVGIILKIPGPIIGLTILAWGNSVADLSANVTMARKGLGNMAMTACFAGPVFNMLVGLGMGFAALSAQTGKSKASVELSPSIITGFLFIALNACVILAVGLVFGIRGRIDKSYGYVALALYLVYLIASLTLQYSKLGEGGE